MFWRFAKNTKFCDTLKFKMGLNGKILTDLMCNILKTADRRTKQMKISDSRIMILYVLHI